MSISITLPIREEIESGSGVMSGVAVGCGSDAIGDSTIESGFSTIFSEAIVSISGCYLAS